MKSYTAPLPLYWRSFSIRSTCVNSILRQQYLDRPSSSSASLRKINRFTPIPFSVVFLEQVQVRVPLVADHFAACKAPYWYNHCYYPIWDWELTRISTTDRSNLCGQNSERTRVSGGYLTVNRHAHLNVCTDPLVWLNLVGSKEKEQDGPTEFKCLCHV